MEILEFFNQLDQDLNLFLLNAGYLAPLFSSIFVVLEGTLAFLPLCVFITINMLSMGTILGSLVSWVCTVTGSLICFSLFRFGLKPLVNKLKKKDKKTNKFMKMINKMKFSRLVLIISIPLTPSFFVNFTAGLSNISFKKYFYALIMGKTCIILFWGVLGTSLVGCLTNPLMFIKVVLMILMCNLVSKFINKHLELDEIFDNQQ